MLRFKEINERMRYVTLKVGEEKLVVVSVYIAQAQEMKQRECLRKDLGDCTESLKVEEKLMAMVDGGNVRTERGLQFWSA